VDYLLSAITSQSVWGALIGAVLLHLTADYLKEWIQHGGRYVAMRITRSREQRQKDRADRIAQLRADENMRHREQVRVWMNLVLSSAFLTMGLLLFVGSQVLQGVVEEVRKLPMELIIFEYSPRARTLYISGIFFMGLMFVQVIKTAQRAKILEESWQALPQNEGAAEP